MQKHRAQIAAVKDQAESQGLNDDDLKGLLSGLIGDKPKKNNEVEIVIVLRRRPDTSEDPPVEAYCRRDGSRPAYFNREDYTARFGAAESDVEQVFGFVKDEGLDVIDDLGETVESLAVPGFMQNCVSRRMLLVRGIQKNIDHAFDINTRHVAIGGAVHRAHDEPVSVPEHLDGIVVWVFGLETQHVPHAGPHIATFAAHQDVLHELNIRPVNPADIARQYDFPENCNGSGQCIGILQPNGGYDESDMQTYFEHAKIEMPDIFPVGINAADWYRERGLSMYNMEVALDTQIAGGLAPGARVAVYMPGRCSTAADAFPKRLYEVLSRAVHDDVNRPSVLSLSWGGPEAIWKEGDRIEIEELLTDAVCLGVTVCTSSGDAGVGPPDPHAGLQTPPACIYPASSPHVLACGGTSLEDHNGATGLYETEIVWNDHSTILQMEFGTSAGVAQSRNGAGASGGGVSECFTVPSYQEAAEVPEKSILYWKEGRVTTGEPIKGRGIPDVAANADIHTGYRIYFDGAYAMGGGTSSAAPLWAALIARLNSALDEPVGFINPILYRMQLDEGLGVCRDITSGNNGGYEARPGWDACTGLGSPNGTAILAALQASIGDNA